MGEPAADAWTRLKLIQWTAGWFEKQGIPDPRLDAELLLAHVLKCPRIELYTAHDRIVSEKDRARFKELVQRRAGREPLQYILGETEFWGLKLNVTPDVLIPRPETELLVEESIKILRGGGGGSPASDPESELGSSAVLPPPPLPKILTILEIGTGSGCIAIALAKELPSARIVSTEISKEALGIARQNAVSHQVSDRIEFILADIAPWKRFTTEERRFDLIVSNPPYIPTGDFPSLQPEVRDFEPRQALDGGPEGLNLIAKILEEATDSLLPSGRLLLEIGSGQSEPLARLLEGYPVWRQREIRRDLSGVPRVAVLLRNEKYLS